MSRHVCFRCGCGREDFAASARFTQLFWNDVLRVLRRAGVENPYRNLPEDAEVDGSGFRRWLEGALERLEAEGDGLPTLHEIWRVRPDDADAAWGSDAGYFVWRGETYMVQAVYDELAVVPLEAEEWERRRGEVPYEPPVVEEAAPELVPAPSPTAGENEEPAFSLSAAEFTRLFRGTPLVLEHGPFPRFLAAETEELRQVARHADEAGERVILYTY